VRHRPQVRSGDLRPSCDRSSPCRDGASARKTSRLHFHVSTWDVPGRRVHRHHQSPRQPSWPWSAACAGPVVEGPGRPLAMSVTSFGRPPRTDGAEAALAAAPAHVPRAPHPSLLSAACMRRSSAGSRPWTGRYTIFPRWLTRLRSWWWTTSRHGRASN
jgi:hypothetical protein